VTGGAGFIGSAACAGLCQHAEKLIPTVIRHALADAPIPLYGTGGNTRDRLYVEAT
jgi:dTDP-glucose 4,6-dehydratase